MPNNNKQRIGSFDDIADDSDSDIAEPYVEIAIEGLALAGTATRKSLWVRPTPKGVGSLPTQDATLLNFEVLAAHIMPCDCDDSKEKRYVIYDLSVRQDTKYRDNQPVLIERRYSDFRKLYLSLKKEFRSELAACDFPNKAFIGNFSTELIAERSAAFETFLVFVASKTKLRESTAFLSFLQDIELKNACRLLDERRNENAIPILENCFRVLNKVFMDRSRPVLLALCRLVAACTALPVPHQSAERWAILALKRYETVCDIDLLTLYIPLLRTCEHLWWQRGRDRKPITDCLTEMARKGFNTNNSNTLMQAIHNLDPRTETI